MLNKNFKSILSPSKYFSADEYAHFDALWKAHENAHWTLDEINLEQDKKDWITLDENTKLFITNVFRLFTQIDLNIFGAYGDFYTQVIQNEKIRSMMTSFQAREVTHYKAYSKLVTELGMPDKIFKDFLNFKEMSEKNDYLNAYKIKKHLPLDELLTIIRMDEAILHTVDPEDRARTDVIEQQIKETKKQVVALYRDLMLSIAVFSAYGEGMHLFSSFAMLLNCGRGGSFVGMNDVLRWSIQDEIMHYMGMLDVYKLLFTELAELGFVEDVESFVSGLEADVKKIAIEMVALEDAFIDLCFSSFSHDSLTKEEMKEYTRYLCDRRTISLGFDPIYGIKNSPIEWIDSIINAVEHANFFETKSSSYQKTLVHSSEKVIDDILFNYKKQESY